MPKGALLHAHLDATVNATCLLQLALKHPNIHIRTSGRITADTIGTLVPEYRPITNSKEVDLPSVTDDSYHPGDWVPLSRARERFPTSMGGPTGFDQWFADAITISPAEAYRTHNTTTKASYSRIFSWQYIDAHLKIWAKFQRTFVTAHVS